MHGLCHSEGGSGRCGLLCRAFTDGDCTIVDEMVFNQPITYSDFLDAVDVYTHLTDLTEKDMDRILKLMLENIAKHNKEMIMLVAISQVPWANLKVDEIVFVSNDFNDFIKGKAMARHYFQLASNNKFQVFCDGKSSATTSNDNVNDYEYAMPKVDYEKLALEK